MPNRRLDGSLAVLSWAQWPWPPRSCKASRVYYWFAFKDFANDENGTHTYEEAIRKLESNQGEPGANGFGTVTIEGKQFKVVPNRRVAEGYVLVDENGKLFSWSTYRANQTAAALTAPQFKTHVEGAALLAGPELFGETALGRGASAMAGAAASRRGASIVTKLEVKSVELLGGQAGRDFVLRGAEGAERFAARLMDGSKTLNVGWTDSIARTTLRLREAQQLAGGPGSFTRITGMASDQLEAAIRAGTFDTAKAAEMLGKSLGGKWQVHVSQRAGQKGVFDIVAELIP